ncbi:hypothetical protein [Streptomyces sp. NPDC058739]|uniref:hypothetical protein n=1 Tax=Streptomyces sp. NPDC058739 TaxID=3346618 RepID=UPI0036966425
MKPVYRVVIAVTMAVLVWSLVMAAAGQTAAIAALAPALALTVQQIVRTVRPQPPSSAVPAPGPAVDNAAPGARRDTAADEEGGAP